MDYYAKYMKYKAKYNNLKGGANQRGGAHYSCNIEYKNVNQQTTILILNEQIKQYNKLPLNNNNITMGEWDNNNSMYDFTMGQLNGNISLTIKETSIIANIRVYADNLKDLCDIIFTNIANQLATITIDKKNIIFKS